MRRPSIAALASAAFFLAAPEASAAGTPFEQGQALYAEHCAICHGRDGRGGEGFKTPIWGQQTQISKFDTAMGLFEYNQMLMPFDDPTKLTDEQKWAIVNYILVNHGATTREQPVTPANAAGIPIK